MSRLDSEFPEWEDVLSSASRLQPMAPDAIYAAHRLRARFNEVLADLESVAGWKTARVNRPVQILGSLDGIQTGVRQLVRTAPLETTEVTVGGQPLTVPTPAEILRIKGCLILARNATRDYVDFAALGDHLGSRAVTKALSRLDELYPQKNGESALQQLLTQTASPQPYDLENVDLSNFKGLDARWHTWDAVSEACENIVMAAFRGLARTTHGHGR